MDVVLAAVGVAEDGRLSGKRIRGRADQRAFRPRRARRVRRVRVSPGQVFLPDARVVIEDWRKDYNQPRPHSALGREAPAVFAAARSSPGRCRYGCAPVRARGGDLPLDRDGLVGRSRAVDMHDQCLPVELVDEFKAPASCHSAVWSNGKIGRPHMPGASARRRSSGPVESPSRRHLGFAQELPLDRRVRRRAAEPCWCDRRDGDRREVQVLVGGLDERGIRRWAAAEAL